MKHYKTIALALIILIPALRLKANPKDFEGVIVYNITYESADMNEQMMAMMPKTMKLMIKDGKSRTELNTGMGSQVEIFDAESKSSITLIDMMGKKYAIRKTTEDIDKDLKDAPKMDIEKTGNTKEIAGYEAKEAIVKSEDGKKNFTVYYTDELGSGILNENNPYYKDIDGIMLEFAMDENRIKMEFSAISVDKKKISGKEFEIPEGYQEISIDEYKSMFGGGGF